MDPNVRREDARLRVGVVLYRNSREEIERLVASLRAAEAAPQRFEVAWIDNSPDQELMPFVRDVGVGTYRHAGRNLGFGAAHNVLMAESFSGGAAYYCCLNPDALLHPDALTELVRQAHSQRRAGLVEALQFPDEHPKKYDPETGETTWCSGCVLLVTREAYEAVGGFDERFFMYCEDVDLSWRVRAAGLKTLVAPRALVHHHVTDRIPSVGIIVQTLRSGAYLGRKYGNSRFAADCLRQLQEYDDGEISMPNPGTPSRALAAVANFSQQFHFAGVRW